MLEEHKDGVPCLCLQCWGMIPIGAPGKNRLGFFCHFLWSTVKVIFGQASISQEVTEPGVIWTNLFHKHKTRDSLLLFPCCFVFFEQDCFQKFVFGIHFRFAVYGDFGNDNAQSLPRLQQEIQRGKIDAVLHVGDMAYDLATVSLSTIET